MASTAVQNTSSADTHENARDRQVADPPCTWHRGRPHVVRRQGHAKEVAGDHDNDHQHGGQDRVSGHDQADRQEEHLHDFLGDGIQGVGQDALERYPAFFYRGHNALESRLGQHDSGRRLGNVRRGRNRNSHLRLAQRWRVIGAIAAHADGVAALLKRLNEVILILRKNSGKNREVFSDAHSPGLARADRSRHQVPPLAR